MISDQSYEIKNSMILFVINSINIKTLLIKQQNIFQFKFHFLFLLLLCSMSEKRLLRFGIILKPKVILSQIKLKFISAANIPQLAVYLYLTKDKYCSKN